MKKISEVLKNNLLYITAFNITDHHVALPFKTEIGKFSILTLKEAKNLIPIDAEMLAFAKMNNPDDIEMGINELIQHNCDNQQSQQQRQPEYEKFWFPTPETCQNPELLPQIQRDIYDQILHFQGLEKIEPKMRSQKAEQSMKQSNPPFQQNKNNTNQNGQFSGYQNQNNLPGQQQSGRKGKNRNNWQNQFGFSNNQPKFQNTGPIAPQQYPQWYLYQQYQNMQQNQPIVQIQPAQVQRELPAQVQRAQVKRELPATTTLLHWKSDSAS